jgi:hypothetical protein
MLFLITVHLKIILLKYVSVSSFNHIERYSSLRIIKMYAGGTKHIGGPQTENPWTLFHSYILKRATLFSIKCSLTDVRLASTVPLSVMGRSLTCSWTVSIFWRSCGVNIPQIPQVLRSKNLTRFMLLLLEDVRVYKSIYTLESPYGSPHDKVIYFFGYLTTNFELRMVNRTDKSNKKDKCLIHWLHYAVRICM